MTRLSSSSPGHREHELGRAGDARALEDADLGRVTAHDDRAELALEAREAVGPLLDQRHLVAHLEQRARRVRTYLPSTRDDHVHQVASAGSGVAARTVSRSDRDRGLRRADGLQPALRVELGARRVEHAHDDGADPVALLEHLPDDDVRVVAVGGDHGSFDLCGPRLVEHGRVHSVAEHEAAPPARPEPLQRVLRLVHDGDVPAVCREALRDGGPDASTADDDGPHGGIVGREVCVPTRTRRRGMRRRAPRTAPAVTRSPRSVRRSATGAASAARSRGR